MTTSMANPGAWIAYAGSLREGARNGRRFLREGLKDGRVFQIALIAVSLLPLIIGIVSQNWTWTFGLPVVLFMVWMIGTLSGTHVFATMYLMLDRRQHAGVLNVRRNLYVVPLAIIAANMIALLALPLWALLAFMLFYIHYAMFHFGRQNLGVMAFSSMISRRRPMSQFERRTIQGMVFAGMLGAYSIFAPALMLDQKLFPLSLAYVDPIMTKLWYAGAAVYAALTVAVLWHVARNWKTYPTENLLLYLSAVFFYLPVFITTNPAYTLGAWSNAHGLQYLVFLLFHAIGRTQANNEKASSLLKGRTPAFWTAVACLPLLGFAAAAYAGQVIWSTVASVQRQEVHLLDFILAHETEVKLLTGIILGITMAHYWVDQHLWRLQTKERRAWLAQYYPFLAGGPKPVNAPAPAAPARVA